MKPRPVDLISCLSLIPDKKTKTETSSLNDVMVCPSCGHQFVQASVKDIPVKVCESCRMVLPDITEDL